MAVGHRTDIAALSHRAEDLVDHACVRLGALTADGVVVTEGVRARTELPEPELGGRFGQEIEDVVRALDRHTGLRGQLDAERNPGPDDGERSGRHGCDAATTRA